MTRFLRSPAALAASVTHDLVTTVFPADCRVCGGPLTRASSVPVCQSCQTLLTPRQDPGCRRCGDLLPFAQDAEDLGSLGLECMACRLVPPQFERAVAYGDYESSLRELIHLLKYERMPALARTLGARLAQAVQTLRPVAAEELLVVAVPLFGRAERRRGYNQARLLADEALRQLRRTEPAWRLEAAHTLLVRKTSTAHQFELSQRDRRRNLQGAFAVPAGAAAQLRGREVLLLDDILTTGATARECARMLRQAGASKVWVATVARACAESRPLRRRQMASAVARWGEASD